MQFEMFVRNQKVSINGLKGCRPGDKAPYFSECYKMSGFFLSLEIY